MAGGVPEVNGVPHGREGSLCLGGVPKVAPAQLCIAPDVGGQQGQGSAASWVTGALLLRVFIVPKAQLQLPGTLT